MNYRQLINGLYNWINASPNLMFMALKFDCDFKTFETGLGMERYFIQLKHRFKNIIVNCELIKRVTSNGSEDEVTILFYLPYHYGNSYTFSKSDTILSCELNYYEELPLIFYRRFYNFLIDFVDPIVLCCGYEKEECKDIYKDIYKEEPKEEPKEVRRMTREKALKTLKENLCGWCAYGAKNMESCDIRGCDNKDAIQTLEKEPCTVTEFADRCRKCGAKYGKLLKQTSWIPVSERLPEDETDVLTCNAEGNVEIASGYYSTEVTGFIWCTSSWKLGEVIAWMPLPEPYKEKEE